MRGLLTPMIDSHVHLNRQEFDGDWRGVAARATEAGVRGFLNVGYDPDSSAASLALAEADPRILATVGVHPHDAALLADAEGRRTDAGETVLAQLETWAAHPRVVAIGEIGLDFFRDLSPRPAQRTALALQLKLAERTGLPVVFHIRDAWTETLALIDQLGVPSRGGILHAFSGDAASVDWARARGFLLGIGGPVTYKKSGLPDLVAKAGLDLLLLETDAPWLPPVPWRGKRNESAYLAHTCAKVAECLDRSEADIAAETTAAFCRLMNVTAGPDGLAT